jgi:hypothetical protein
MNRIILFLVATIFITACSTGSARLTSTEQALIDELKLDESIFIQIKSLGGTIERLTDVTYGFGLAAENAVVFVTDRKDGKVLLSEVRTMLQGSSYSAYLNSVLGDRVAILKDIDQYGYLDVVYTDGINYGLEHEDIMAKYRYWDEQYGLSLFGASYDWLEAEFQSPPSDWISFAHEVYDFSPDVVDQGTGDIESLADEMRDTNTLFLWWD